MEGKVTMKYLVLGSNGMAGHTIALYLISQGHDVLGFGRKTSSLFKSVTGDVTNTEMLKELIESELFDIIVNCVGVLNQFAEKEKANAVLINSYLPHYLAEITLHLDTQVVHLSTDCVFSGRRGEYTEHDFRDGTSFYDRSKALGELEDSKNVTLRSSIVGPDINRDGIGLFNWFMQQKGPILGYTKVLWTGQTTLQLAKAIEQVSKERVNGLINMVPDSAISKYDLLQLFNKYFRNNSVVIHPDTDYISDKSLKRTRFDFIYRVPDYEQMIYELYGWVINHKELYPHYFPDFRTSMLPQ